jgi:hypothetical protein
MPTKLNTIAGVNFSTALGGAPSSGDLVYVKEGNDTYTAGLSLAAVDLNLLALMPGWGGDMGNDSAYLDLSVSSGVDPRLILAWSGRFAHIRGGTAAAFDTVEMRPTRGGRVVLRDADVPNIIQSSGVLELKETLDAENVRVGGGKCVLEYSSEAGTLAEASAAGLIEIHRVMATVRAMGGGRVIFGRDDKPPSTALEVLGGGYAKYIGGTLPSLVLKPGGVLDLREATQPITITAAELHEGGKILFPIGSAALTWTAATVYGRDPRNPE